MLQRDMMVTDYTTKIKEICDALGFINMTVNEDKMVNIFLGGLAQRYNPIQMAIFTRRSHHHSSTSKKFFWLKKTMQVRQGACSLTGRCYTRRRISPVVVEDEVDRHSHNGGS